MDSSIAKLCILLVFALATLAAAEPPLTAQPKQGAVLLKNGHLIEGQITLAGDYYYVVVPNGEIRLKAAEVEFVCRDVEQAYQRKRSTIRRGRVDDHLQLAHWCLGKGLIGHAGAELADAWDAEPDHPAIEVLQRRLRAAMEPTRPPSPTPTPIDTPPAPEELQKMVRGLPHGSVATFTETIQPLLANNCMTSGCHGSGSDTPFQLLRLPHGKPPSRQTTLRNLQTALEWVDRESPDSSRLLTVIREPHGKAQAPVFNKYQTDQYQRLAAWVHTVTGHARPPAPASLVAESRPLQPSPEPGTPTAGDDQAASSLPPRPFDPRNPFAADGSTVMPATYHENVQDVGEADREATVAKGPGAGNTPPVNRGPAAQQFVPADPFDPEIFNRRYGNPKK